MRYLLTFGLLLATVPVMAQQASPIPDLPPQNPQSETASQPDQAGKRATDQSQGDQASGETDKKPGPLGRLKRHLQKQMSSGCVNALGNHCWDKSATDDSQQSGSEKQTQNAPPRSDNTPAGESSSKSTKIDLSPPPGEAAPPGMETNGDADTTADVQEMKPWDPHKADKDIEVGDFYFKQKNYRAALSRYQGALHWQDNNAIAMFRLGQTNEKMGNFAEARKGYEGYLKILPDGQFSADAKKGLERLKDKPDEVSTAGNRPE